MAFPADPPQPHGETSLVESASTLQRIASREEIVHSAQAFAAFIAAGERQHVYCDALHGLLKRC